MVEGRTPRPARWSPKLGRRRPPGKFDKVVIKVRATCERLRQHAAATRFRVPLVGGEVARRLSDGLADPVVVDDYVVYPRRNGWAFRGVPMSTAIVDTERQCPTYTHTEHLFGEFEDGDDAAALYAKNLRSESPFRGVDRIKLIMSLLTFPRRDGGAGLPLDKLVARGVLAAAFPLHDFDELKFLERKWLVYFRVDSKASTRLQCARTRTVWTRLFDRTSRTRREQSSRPKISRIDFDLTELEGSEVWWGPPKPVVGIHTGLLCVALEDALPPHLRLLRGEDRLLLRLPGLCGCQRPLWGVGSHHA